MFKVTCVYREPMTSVYGGKVYGGKVYDFMATEETKPEEGTLITVQDRYGISLVKCIRVEKVEELPEYIKSVVKLEDVNKVVLEQKRKKDLEKEIRESLVKDLEERAFAQLAANKPELVDKIKEYMELGGTYNLVMPTVKELE